MIRNKMIIEIYLHIINICYCFHAFLIQFYVLAIILLNNIKNWNNLWRCIVTFLKIEIFLHIINIVYFFMHVLAFCLINLKIEMFYGDVLSRFTYKFNDNGYCLQIKYIYLNMIYEHCWKKYWYLFVTFLV
jgi:hypothetical protein